MRLYTLLIMFALLFFGCTEKEQISSETLSLSLVSNSEQLMVLDYQVREHAFVNSHQQGQFQAHLFDEEGTVLQKINFEKIELPVADTENNQADFHVSLPLLPETVRLEIYQLDGSSGHYQLKTDDPLLDWSIPQEIKQRFDTDKQ